MIIKNIDLSKHLSVMEIAKALGIGVINYPSTGQAVKLLATGNRKDEIAVLFGVDEDLLNEALNSSNYFEEAEKLNHTAESDYYLLGYVHEVISFSRMRSLRHLSYEHIIKMYMPFIEQIKAASEEKTGPALRHKIRAATYCGHCIGALYSSIEYQEIIKTGNYSSGPFLLGVDVYFSPAIYGKVEAELTNPDFLDWWQINIIKKVCNEIGAAISYSGGLSNNSLIGLLHWAKDQQLIRPGDGLLYDMASKKRQRDAGVFTKALVEHAIKHFGDASPAEIRRNLPFEIPDYGEISDNGKGFKCKSQTTSESSINRYRKKYR